MLIRSTSAAATAATLYRNTPTSRPPETQPEAKSATRFDSLTLSAAAQQAYVAFAAANSAANSANNTREDPAIATRLAEIKASGPVNRSMEDSEFLMAHDKKLAAILAQGKQDHQLTADDLDYLQKATGFVNTMANLSPAEKALYDKAVASGHQEAAAGFSQIALIRMMGPMAGGANGHTYDPLKTEITANSIAMHFSHSIIDPSGRAQASFTALMQFLRENSMV